MSYTNTIEDIKNRTGLKDAFIRKTLINLQDIFKNYSKRGINNSFLFDENAMQIWDRIKQAKEQNLNIEAIRENIVSSLNNKSDQTSTKTYVDQSVNLNLEQVLKQARESLLMVMQAKDETIKTKDLLITELQNKILLITDGKSPEIIKNEYFNKDLELVKLQSENNHNLEKINSISSQLEKTELNNKRKNELIQELQILEGKFWKGKKRKLIIQELQMI